MEGLEAELERARELEVSALADAIETIGFECTRCGGCCTGYETASEAGAVSEDAEEEAASTDDDACHDDREPHTATVFPDEVRTLQAAAEAEFGEEYDWRDAARPMPYGLTEDEDGEPVGETFEWAIATDECGDCTFYDDGDGGPGACTVHDARPLICRTYPFSIALGGTSQPMGEAVDSAGMVRAHECEGLGRDIDREAAESLADALKERAVRELKEAIAVRDGYDPTAAARTDSEVVVHDSEGAKRPDGTPIPEE
ncbi:YkgJ family cysteine cluster protein [Halorubrum gandharaense]